MCVYTCMSVCACICLFLNPAVVLVIAASGLRNYCLESSGEKVQVLLQTLQRNGAESKWPLHTRSFSLQEISYPTHI